MRRLITAVLDNNYHGNGVVEQLKVQPQQSLEDKLYSSIVVHVAAVFTGKENDNLTQLFHIMMTNPGILKVIVINNVCTYQFLLGCIFTNYARRYC